MNVNSVIAAIDAAFHQSLAPERGIGCCRVYVCIRDKEAAKLVAKAAKVRGKIYQKKAHYGLREALYVGYDNCDGRALATGTALVAALKAVGIAAYREEGAD